MNIRGLPEFLKTEFTYPVGIQQVVERIGEVEVDAPDTDDSESIATVLDPLGAVTFDSAEDLYNMILGNLSDDFIGRKFYDDRGANPMPTPKSATDPENQSF